ncbi:hypothetical protein [Shimia sp. Alg240-R146]|uniref:hypothetical protein n=1 Tax=Shimia sp. Alg240-R146 TaxID=2993449 RepID=UPI0022E7420C|nr:hypothetical protein [Shimia sp. Alg240-R146]
MSNQQEPNAVKHKHSQYGKETPLHPKEKAARELLKRNLARLDPAFAENLNQLLANDIPQEVFRLHFEIFDLDSDGDFPIRAFFFDEDWNEVFLTINGRFEYPAKPELLEQHALFTSEEARRFLSLAGAEDNAFCDLYEEEVIGWFGNHWSRSRGVRLTCFASIGCHDSDAKSLPTATR